jgi:uncharacterized membrane protein
MTAMFLLFILFVASGLLQIGLALPLIYRKIPPNRLYGFRVRCTLEDKDVWYAANAFAGKRLAWAGVATAAAAVIFYVLPIRRVDTYAVAVASVVLFGLTVAVVQSFRYLYGELGESGKTERGADSNKNAQP